MLNLNLTFIYKIEVGLSLYSLNMQEKLLNIKEKKKKKTIISFSSQITIFT